MARSGPRWCCPLLAAWFLTNHQSKLGVDEHSLLCKIDVHQNLQVRDVVRALKHAANWPDKILTSMALIRFVVVVQQPFSTSRLTVWPVGIRLRRALYAN